MYLMSEFRSLAARDRWMLSHPVLLRVQKKAGKGIRLKLSDHQDLVSHTIWIPLQVWMFEDWRMRQPFRLFGKTSQVLHTRRI